MKENNLIMIMILSLIIGISGCASINIPDNIPENLPSSPISKDTMNELNEENKGEPIEEMVEDTVDEPIDESMGNIMNETVEMPSQLSSPKIIVRKSARKLDLWDGDTLFQSYPIGLGFNPIGHKAVEGDGRTPEGNYYVCTRNDQSKFYKSLGVSYPNKEDASIALDAEAIEAFTYESIADSIDRKIKPPWDTSMGGQIMIHGHGSHRDWTEGCVAVDDDIMDILWNYCPVGTPITIYP